MIVRLIAWWNETRTTIAVGNFFAKWVPILALVALMLLTGVDY